MFLKLFLKLFEAGHATRLGRRRLHNKRKIASKTSTKKNSTKVYASPFCKKDNYQGTQFPDIQAIFANQVVLGVGLRSPMGKLRVFFWRIFFSGLAFWVKPIWNRTLRCGDFQIACTYSSKSKSLILTMGPCCKTDSGRSCYSADLNAAFRTNRA